MLLRSLFEGRRAASVRHVVRGSVGVAALLVTAEAVIRLAGGGSGVPAPTEVLRSAVLLSRDGELPTSLWSTAEVSLLGLGLAFVVAVPAGLLLAAVPVVGEAARLLVEFLRPIPSVALVPITLVFAETVIQMQLFVTAYAACWPILLATVYAIQQVDPLRTETAHTFGIGRMATAVRVLLPSALPGIATGVRTASGIAVVVAVGTEVVGGGSAGLGGLALQVSQANGSTPAVLACALSAALLGLVVDGAVRTVRSAVCGWNDRSQAVVS